MRQFFKDFWASLFTLQNFLAEAFKQVFWGVISTAAGRAALWVFDIRVANEMEFWVVLPLAISVMLWAIGNALAPRSFQLANSTPEEKAPGTGFSRFLRSTPSYSPQPPLPFLLATASPLSRFSFRYRLTSRFHPKNSLSTAAWRSSSPGSAVRSSRPCSRM